MCEIFDVILVSLWLTYCFDISIVDIKLANADYKYLLTSAKFYEQEKSMRICQKVMFLPQELMPIETLRTLLQKTHSISEIC